MNAESTDADGLKKTLYAGVIPEVYKNVVRDIEIKEVRRKVSNEPKAEGSARSPYGTQEEMMENAKEGYFVRDPKRNRVHCPNWELLHQNRNSLRKMVTSDM